MCRGQGGFACCSPTLAAVGVAILAFLAGGVGVASWAVPPTILSLMKAQVHAAFTYTEGSKLYDAWISDLSSEAPKVNFYVTVFNVTNPVEAQNGAKPHLEEVGPLHFRFADRRLNVTYELDGDMAKYWLWEYYIPEDAATLALLEETVHQVYMPLQVWGQQAALDKVVAGIANKTAVEYGQADLFRAKTIREVLFGYTDPFVEFAASFANSLEKSGPPLPTRFAGLLPNITTAGEVMNTTGPVRQYTGKHTRWRAYEFTEWNGQASLQCCKTGPCVGAHPAANEAPTPTWGSIEANLVRGTYGTQFRQGLKPGDTVYAFEDNLIRWVPLVNLDNQVVTHRGIDTLRFILDPLALQNATLNPANAAFNMTGPSGMIPIGGCAQGIPVFVSKPHFLDASSDVATGVTGLAPPSAADETMLDVEPNTGATLYVHERLQINVKLDPAYTCYNATDIITTTPCFPDLKAAYMPMIWVDRWADLSQADADAFHASVGTALTLAHDLPYALPALAGALAVAAVALLIMLGRRRAALLRGEIDPEDGICCPGPEAGAAGGPEKDEGWGGLGGRGASAPYSSLNGM